ncbi:carbohydrate ABC transporter permease [Frigoribacterium sp. PhB24]|uniref:carbohydrate ABC transporter permease n=1 Tax=Frigoribacterium sp. PhB24 TaxID=2485204 RepID=UPI000F493507|nr:carbohydrate ABC transporter permease [Frigoribacterium sp. PhB24]ROS48865.1 carbohydrate ABC transporter membrane protein 2 (CUT1 family) [Frigoribacterium sp. PhB24]
MSISTKLPLADSLHRVERGSVAPGGRRRQGGSFRRAGWLTYVLLTALSIFALGPILFFFFNAVKSQGEFASNPLGVPRVWEWGNFTSAWTEAAMGAGLVNSAIVVLGTVAVTVVVASSAAYALARLEIRGGTTFVTYLLVTSSLPTQMFLVPLFYLWADLNLYDTRVGLILIYVGLFSPFATLLLRSFMLTMPKEFEEAARMDGASELGVLFKVVLPNALPGMLTIALVTALSAYNEFLFAITFIQTGSLLPVSTTFFTFQQGFTQNFALISAAGIIMIAPMLILFLVLQRRFIDGLASSGLGGS